ncbi:hypothetical protein JCM3774_005692 [Rhodotorula dairenensis]
MPAAGSDDVNMREARLEALVHVLGFADLDDLENFVYLHGSVKVVPTAQRDTLPLDETQTQASEEHRARRRLDRLHENAQLKADLERTKVDLAWHKLELQRERAHGEALIEDKLRLLDGLATPGLSNQEEEAVGLDAASCPGVESSPQRDIPAATVASDGRACGSSKYLGGLAGSQGLVERSGGSAPVGDSDSNASIRGRLPSTTSDDATGTSTSPQQPGAVRVGSAETVVEGQVYTSSRITAQGTPLQAPRAPSDQIRSATVIISDRLIASANSSERSVALDQALIGSRAGGTTTPAPLRRPISRLSEPTASLVGSPTASALRKISLYPKLLATRREFREAVRQAQERLSHLEERLRVATDTIRSAVLASFGPAPARLDLDAYPNALELPVEADRRAALLQSADFDASYLALYHQEQELSRQDALVRKWIASVENLLSEVSTATPTPAATVAQFRPSPAPSTSGAIRKRRRVTGQSVLSPLVGRASTAYDPNVECDPSVAPAPRSAGATTDPGSSDERPAPLDAGDPHAPDAAQYAHDGYRSRLSQATNAANEDACPTSGTKNATLMRGSTYSGISVGVHGLIAPSSLSGKVSSRRTSLDENGSPSAPNPPSPTNGTLPTISVPVTPPRGTLPRPTQRSHSGGPRALAASGGLARGQHVDHDKRVSAIRLAAPQARVVDAGLCTTSDSGRGTFTSQDGRKLKTSIGEGPDTPNRVKEEVSQVVEMVDGNQRACDSAAGYILRSEDKDTLSTERVSMSPTDVWFDLDALTPPAVDEETRKKLKKRNQLKRKRRRDGSNTAGSAGIPNAAAGAPSTHS